MHTFKFLFVFLLLPGITSAELRPLEAELHPVGHKAAVIYKTTPQGDLKVNLYFPPDWKALDQRPAIILFFGDSCAKGSPAQFADTAEYFAKRGRVAAAPGYRIESVHRTPPERCIEDPRAPFAGCARMRAIWELIRAA